MYVERTASSGHDDWAAARSAVLIASEHSELVDGVCTQAVQRH